MSAGSRLSWGHALVVAAALLLLAVVAGASALWVVFDAERAEAEARIAEESKLIEEAARSVIIDALEHRFALAFAHAQDILDDPLRADEGLVLVQDGVQLLPRTMAPRRPQGAGELALLDIAMRSGAPVAAPESTLELIEGARRVASAAGDAAFVAAVRAYLEHRAHSEPPGAHDVVATLWVIDQLLARGDADPALVRTMLRDGSVVGGVRVVSLQQVLLRVLPSMSASDGAWLSEALEERCAAARVDLSLFAARRRELEQAPLALPMAAGPEPIALPGLVYLTSTARPGGLAGVRLAEAEARALVDDDLRRRALLREGESVAIEGTGDSQLVRALLTSPRLQEARASAGKRHEAKRSLLVVTGVLALGMLAAAAAELRRRRRYQALRTGFLAAVSHELRTPLASMRLLVDAMLVRASDARASESLDRLGRDIDGLDFLVENILSFSRLERGRLEPRKQRTSLAEIAGDAAGRAQLEGAGVTVALVVDNEAVIEADPELVGVVIANLVRNGWQHNPRALRTVTVRISASPAQGTAHVEVSDDGPGVSEQDRATIFDEFVRGARPTTRGTGLGLALCRQIARVHGGDVTLAATGTSGSTFLLTLPLS